MIQLDGVTKRYRGQSESDAALQPLNLTIEPGSITGILGPNGCGKTTLLRMIAGQLEPSAGTIRVNGAATTTDERVARCVIAHEGNNFGEISMKEVLGFARLRPGWDEELYQHCAHRFDLPERGKVEKLSLGKQSGFAAALALASMAPIVILDEVHAGMDVPTRYALYEEIITANAERGQTFLISTHLVAELDRVIGHLVVLNRGMVLADEAADDFTARFVTVTGPASAVRDAVQNRRVLAERALGPTLEVTLDGPLPADILERGRLASAPLTMQDAFAALIQEAGR